MDYIKLVENINQELYELMPENAPEIISFIEENPPLEIRSCGYAHNISFFGLLIWCSENDERPYENENDPELCDHIPLERWIWKEMMKILSLMNQFNEVIKRRKHVR